MSKRKVQFAEGTKIEEASKRTKRQTDKDQLDKNERDEIDYNPDLQESGSEDEDGNMEGGRLNMDDLEVEEKTVEYDEEVKITPFNLEEEMEDGHFDKDGTFVFNKKSNVKDSWLDEFDFNDVRQLESARLAEEKRKAKLDNDDVEQQDEKLTDCQIYHQILAYLQPGESILRAVRRLGNATKSLSASERLKLKKLAEKQGAQSTVAPVGAGGVDDQKKQLSRLTELADLLIRRGRMNTYEETYESLSFQVKQQVKAAPLAKSPPVSDMFGDEFAETTPALPPSNTNNSAESAKGTGITSDDDVKWEYKTSAEDDSSIHGPVLTDSLMDLIAEAEKNGQKSSTFYVRRHGTSGQFYNASRVDFSIYID